MTYRAWLRFMGHTFVATDESESLETAKDVMQRMAAALPPSFVLGYDEVRSCEDIVGRAGQASDAKRS